MQIARVKDFDQYQSYRAVNEGVEKRRYEAEHALTKGKSREFTVRGFSYPAKTMVDFEVDYNYSDGKTINWRERLVCPVTRLNSRLRASIHFLDMELGLRDYHDIYIAEQVTPLYKYLKQQFPKLTGSEFLGDQVAPGSINAKGIRHETATNLSFGGESLDAYLSFECLEHIPDFRKAFSEAFRVLKKGGKFLWSVPFANLSDKNIIRAYVADDGRTYHILEPEYHGNPVSDQGILCYTHFGWEMLEYVRDQGFRNAYALLYWSDIFGYLGGEQIVFFAEK